MAVGSHTFSGGAYMSADTYPEQEYEMVVDLHTFSEVTYRPAHMHIAHLVFLGQYAAQKYILAEIGWYAICTSITHMIIHL